MWENCHSPAVLRYYHAYTIISNYAKEFCVNFNFSSFFREIIVRNDILLQTHNTVVEKRISSATNFDDYKKSLYSDFELMFDSSIDIEHQKMVKHLYSEIIPKLKKYNPRVNLYGEITDENLSNDESRMPFFSKYSAYWNIDTPINVVRLSPDGKIKAVFCHALCEEREDLSAGIPCIQCGQPTMVCKVAPIPNGNGMEKIGSVMCGKCAKEYDTRHLKLWISGKLLKFLEDGKIEENTPQETNYTVDEVFCWLSKELITNFKKYAKNQGNICQKCNKLVYSCDERKLYNVFNKLPLVLAESISREKKVIHACLNCGYHWDV
jgi:hypothetical protein